VAEAGGFDGSYARDFWDVTNREISGGGLQRLDCIEGSGLTDSEMEESVFQGLST
jgi:hypothetical protein